MTSDLEGVRLLFTFHARRALRGRRGVGVALLVAGSTLLSAFLHFNVTQDPSTLSRTYTFYVLLGVVGPVGAVLLGSTAVASDRESRTIPYLLSRPIRRFALVIGMGGAAIALSGLLGGAVALFSWISMGAPGDPLPSLVAVALESGGLASLYVALGAALRKGWVVALFHAALVEGIFGVLVEPVSRWTASFHSRYLFSRWVGDRELLKMLGNPTISEDLSLSFLVLLGVVGVLLASLWVEFTEIPLRSEESS